MRQMTLNHPRWLADRRRYQRVLKGLAIALAFIFGRDVRTAMAGLTYTVTDLGAGFVPQAINDSGEVGGFSGGNAVLYSGGSVQTLWTDGMALGINSSGQVVGYQGDNTVGFYPQIYSGGVVSSLGSQGNIPVSINDSAQAVGYGVGSTPTAIINSSGFWSPLIGGFPTTGGSQAVAINDNDQVAVETPSGAYLDNLSQNGATNFLGGFTPNGLNDTGQVVGTSSNGGVLYSAGSLESVPGLDNAYGINGDGDIVGEGATSTIGTYYIYPEGDARLYTSGGSQIDFDNLLTASTGWLFFDAIAINDSGQIACIGCPNGDYNDVHGLLLTPASVVPEPAGILLLAASSFGMLARRRHRQLSTQPH